VEAVVDPTPSDLPSALGSGYTAPIGESAEPVGQTADAAEHETSPPAVETATPTTPVARSTPATAQEFGVEPAAASEQTAPAAATPTDSSTGASSGTVRQEFGP
jgi:hypothetical protein